jgi:hypothetical protein
MQISPKILNIPPYISTTWDHITSLKTAIDGDTYILCITLKTGESIKVPSLDQPTIKAIFKAHAEAVEQPIAGTLEGTRDTFRFPIPFSFSIPMSKREGPLTSLGNALNHNPEQAALPDIPSEILNNIAIVAKAFGLEDASALPEPEENCNCVYCQLTRAFKKTTGGNPKEITVSEEELRFRDWEILQSADKLYVVTNPLDANEKYNVFLGDPLGCTCGQKNCEHIKAVLKS